MRCELCRKEASKLVSLALPREDSKFNTRACIPCAENTVYYCKVHKYPHHAFIDQGHACMSCIGTRLEISGQRETAALIGLLSNQLDEDPRDALLKWADRKALREGIFGGRSHVMLQAIVTYAISHGMPEWDVVRMVVERQDVKCLVYASDAPH